MWCLKEGSIYRTTFYEFVRIKYSNFETGTLVDGKMVRYVTEGARSSDKMVWHNISHLKMSQDSIYKMEIDTSDISISFPIHRSR